MEKYLLVSEGPTDYLVIKAVADRLSVDLDKKISIALLEPQKDATSDSYNGHGWGAVKNWCRKYGRKDRAGMSHLELPMQNYLLRQNWQALLAIHDAKGLIVQIDCDIAHFIKDRGEMIKTKKEHCTDALLFWLNEPAQTDQLFLAVSAQAIETWLLATTPPSDKVFHDLPQGFDYELIEDYESRLLALGHTPTIKKNGVRRLKKTPYTCYAKHAERISQNLPDVRARCVSANELCEFLS